MVEYECVVVMVVVVFWRRGVLVYVCERGGRGRGGVEEEKQTSRNIKLRLPVGKREKKSNY